MGQYSFFYSKNRLEEFKLCDGNGIHIATGNLEDIFGEY